MSWYQPTFRGKMLDRLSNGRVFDVAQLGEDRFTVQEACDLYFSEEFTREELRALGEELIAIADGRGLTSLG